MAGARTPADLLDEVKSEFKGKRGRKFSAGLLVALIDLMRYLDSPSLGFKGAADFYAKFPRQTETAAGKAANTLIIKTGTDAKGKDKTASIRTFYNEVEHFFRSDNNRYDYPSAAPHATQAWIDYPHWIDSLVTFDLATLDNLRKEVVDFVLAELPSQEVDYSTLRKDPPTFRIFLDDFDFTAHKGEPTGSAFQGAVFAFIRADSPHLQVQVDKTRTGSKRLDRVGDIDALHGGALVKTCEVKHFEVSGDDIKSFSAFAGEAAQRKADAYVVAEGFGEGVREALSAMGVQAMTRQEMRDHVAVWDTLKQTNAMKAYEYFVLKIERCSSLTNRFKGFCIERGFDAMTSSWPEGKKV
jgi:hypothetical protein